MTNLELASIALDCVKLLPIKEQNTDYKNTALYNLRKLLVQLKSNCGSCHNAVKDHTVGEIPTGRDEHLDTSVKSPRNAPYDMHNIPIKHWCNSCGYILHGKYQVDTDEDGKYICSECGAEIPDSVYYDLRGPTNERLIVIRLQILKRDLKDKGAYNDTCEELDEIISKLQAKSVKLIDHNKCPHRDAGFYTEESDK